MTTSMFSSGKASVSEGLKLSRSILGSKRHRRPYSANGNGHAHPGVNSPSTQRQLLLDVLEANATRRDAKQYLARFKPSQQIFPDPDEAQRHCNKRLHGKQRRPDDLGVNLGGLYAPARAIANSPQFTRQEVQETCFTCNSGNHIALVLFRDPRQCDDATLDGVALTLSQLVKLDMSIGIVLDNGLPEPDLKYARATISTQADRIRSAIDKHHPEGARLVLGALEIPDDCESHAESLHNVEIAVPSLVQEPLLRGTIPIIPTTAFTRTGQINQVAPEAVLRALTRQLVEPADDIKSYGQPHCSTNSVDRIIILDPAGGIPSKDRNDGAHVFINLRQEYPDICKELNLAIEGESNSATAGKDYSRHLKNLEVVDGCLNILPSSSSAIIITPAEAASSSSSTYDDSDLVLARTRKQKNTLIHNLLTNKPLVSSSLPAGRFSKLPVGDQSQYPSRPPSATLLKRGMPLAFVPRPDKTVGWCTPSQGTTPLKLDSDAEVDFPRLLHLIEDSFRRKLDVRHYLERITGSIAGLIVAGNYEGGAILTWETPRSLQHLPPNHPERMGRLVPYLDKFAVLQSSQGSAGVADIVFQSMVRSCFPNGVCWRSRQDNPVNKWYFERATGSWEIPGSNWTMFWIGDGVVDSATRFADYMEVCTNVAPSWADGKKPD